MTRSMLHLFTGPLSVLIAVCAVTALPAVAQEETEPDFTAMFEEVTNAAASMAANVEAVTTALDASIGSAEEAQQVLGSMEEAVRAALGSLADDGVVWSQLQLALETWEEKRQAALDKAVEQPSFEDIAEAWGDKITDAQALRSTIVEQRAGSLATLEEILERRDIIIANFELQRADAALEALREVRSNLATINDTMGSILEQTRDVTGITN